MLVSDMCIKTLSTVCINAIQQFQIVTKEKECYLAFYVCSTISMSFDAMTTSPVESMNSCSKRGMGINKNSNTRFVNGLMISQYSWIFLDMYTNGKTAVTHSLILQKEVNIEFMLLRKKPIDNYNVHH